jgi:hypothetical protein
MIPPKTPVRRVSPQSSLAYVHLPKVIVTSEIIRSNHHVNTVETGRVLGQYSGSYPRQATCLCLWAGRSSKIRRWQNLRGRTSWAPLRFAADWEPPAVCPGSPLSYPDLRTAYSNSGATLQHCEERLVVWSCPSICPNGSTWIPLDGLFTVIYRVRARMKSGKIRRRSMARLAVTYRWLMLHTKWEHTFHVNCIVSPQNLTIC